MIGAGLLRAGEGEKASLCQGLRARANAQSRVVVSGSRQRQCQRQSDGASGRGLAGGGGTVRQVPVGDMRRLMGEDRLQLGRAFQAHQKPGMDEDMAPVGDEGVQAVIVDDDDPDRARQAGFGQNGRGQLTQIPARSRHRG